MTAATNTVTRTSTVTLTDVSHVLWRIQSDLRTLRAQHQMITTDRELEIGEDLLLWIYRGFVDAIEFRFVNRGSLDRRYAVLYSLTRSWAGDQDDASGGIRYVDLRGTEFTVLLTNSVVWRALSQADRHAFYQECACKWGPMNDTAANAGYWTADRMYGSGGLGASRSVFRPA